ncbi:MAG: 3-phosphoglycerate dehydrogenase family protein [Oscillospiraceae bacterium]|nr:3-phosphoglycerate dehydrogenase family protein [Oscillospiraceae bacterium]
MYTIKTLNKIARIGLDRLDSKLFRVDDASDAPEGILLRSADMLEMQMPASLLAIGRAGAGTNNIPSDRCAADGICVFNTPGANANAVKELAICSLLLSSRNIYEGICWCQGLSDGETTVDKQVEKGKSAFVGPELLGKTLGVVGMGAIGRLVAEAAKGLGMHVIGYDPFLQQADVPLVSLDELYAAADYITLHVPANKDTKGMIDEAAISKMKDGARIVNLARGTLVKTDALLAALDAGKLAAYVVDFPDAGVLGHKGIVTIPHLGASTPEAEDNCAIMAADQVGDFLLNGNIKNAVNLPSVSLPRTGAARITVLSKGADAAAIADAAGKVTASASGTRGEYAYAIFDGAVAPDAVRAIPGVIRVREL